MFFMKFIFTFLLAVVVAQSSFGRTDPRLAKASRYDKAGWVYVHLEGSPETIGYQHGYLLSGEINDAIKAMSFYLQHSTGKNWDFYRNASKTMFWNKIDPEYQQEITGIVEGLKAKKYHYDVYDIVALNGIEELAYYYVPYLANKMVPGSLANKAPGNCSAFIATGSYTSDHKIVMGHNAWVDYVMGERWNIIADITPEKGNRMLMDIFPGFIDSGDDFGESSSGILITETTISGFRGFDPNGIPEFVRARKAIQYANSINDVIRIMLKGNNGGYANDWLMGDTKTNEIARLELGLKDHRVWRTKNGIYVGSNYPSDPKLMKEETTFNPNNPNSSPNSRKYCWEKITAQYKGKIDAQTGMEMESSMHNYRTGADESNRCVIAGRVDTDPQGAPEWDLPPFFPIGTVQAKLTTSDLAKHMQFWAHMGNPGGGDFLARPFFKMHPQYKWESKYLRDMKAYPWTMFSAEQTPVMK
jgi:hypothetical protein